MKSRSQAKYHTHWSENNTSAQGGMVSFRAVKTLSGWEAAHCDEALKEEAWVLNKLLACLW